MDLIPGEMRESALKRIETLDCANPDKTTLASCDPDAETPPKVLAWQEKLKAASADETAYAKALAKELRRLVCESADPIYILRGTIKSGRLAKTGPEAPALVDFIKSEKCPVSTSLTDDDKAFLMKIKQDAEKEFAPASASNKKEWTGNRPLAR